VGWLVWSCARSRRSGRGRVVGRGSRLRRGVTAVLFEVELSLEGVVDGLDDWSTRPTRGGTSAAAVLSRSCERACPAGT
jgi:hypothetical protein